MSSVASSIPELNDWHVVIRGWVLGVFNGAHLATLYSSGYPNAVMRKCSSKAEADRVFQEGLLANARREAAQLATRGHPIPEEIRALLQTNAVPSVVPVASGIPPSTPAVTTDPLPTIGPSSSSPLPQPSVVPVASGIPPSTPAVTTHPLPTTGPSSSSPLPHTEPHVPLSLYKGENHTGAPAPADPIAGFPPTSHSIEDRILPANAKPPITTIQPPSPLPSSVTLPAPPSPSDGFTDLETLTSLSDYGSDGNDTSVPVYFLSDHDSDYGEGVDDPNIIANSVVLPDPESVTGAVDVVANIPDVQGPEPYIVQVALPRDYIDRGLDVRIRVNINNVSQVTVSAAGHTTHGTFHVNGESARDEERYFVWRDSQRVDDNVLRHLQAAVACSMPQPSNSAPDPARTRVINDMAAVLSDVLQGGYAYYSIVRGHGPAVYRGTWKDVQPKVDNDGALYQAFQGGRAARRWFRRSSKFMRDFDTNPLNLEAFGPGSGA